MVRDYLKQELIPRSSVLVRAMLKFFIMATPRSAKSLMTLGSVARFLQRLRLAWPVCQQQVVDDEQNLHSTQGVSVALSVMPNSWIGRPQLSVDVHGLEELGGV